MIPGIRGKASVASVNGAGGALLGERKPIKFSGFKERLDWLETDLNAAKIITVQTINAQKINVNGSTHIQQY